MRTGTVWRCVWGMGVAIAFACLRAPAAEAAIADDALCYKSKLAPGAPLLGPGPFALTDAFESGNFDAKKLVSLCPPTNVDGGGILDPATGFHAVQIRAVRGAPRHVKQKSVRISTEFGEYVVETRKPELLLLPAAFSLTGTDPAVPDPAQHQRDVQKCYQVKIPPGEAQPAGLQVTAQDVFTTSPKSFLLKKLRRVCLPATKDGEPPLFPGTGLACFQVRTAPGQPKHMKRTGVRFASEIGTSQANTTIEDDLCVPAIFNRPPVAVAIVTPTVGPAPLRITADATGSTDPDGTIASYVWSFAGATTTNGQRVTHTFSSPGEHNIALHVTDNQGLVTSIGKTVQVLSPSQLPTATFTLTPAFGAAPLAVSFNASGSTSPGSAITSYVWDFSDGATATGVTTLHTFASAGVYTITLRVTNQQGGFHTASRTLVVGGAATIPPDPATIATMVNDTVSSSLGTALEFLYSGPTRVQSGVAPGTILPERTALLRGRVLGTDHLPMSGVLVRIQGHPEYGSTATRADGKFDMVVNGGGRLVVDFTKGGYVRAQRQVELVWQESLGLDDVVLVAFDTAVNPIDLNAGTPIQVARGNPVSDADGTRRGTLFVPDGVQANLVMPDGSRPSISNLSVHVTELTDGDAGPEAMPADLPAASAYTYAVVFHADEALAAGAVDVEFSSPLPYYVENFLGFPVGIDVPLGSYDPLRSVWVASENGRIVKIESAVPGGLAELDTDGVGGVDNGVALGITDDERAALANLYPSGTTLWRVTIPHFDAPWDENWNFSPPPDAEDPENPEPEEEGPPKDQCEQGGSTISCESQTLGETVELVGTPYSLEYRSDRVLGYTAAAALDIQLTGPTIPASLQRIDLQIDVAGKTLRQSFTPQAGLKTPFDWDGIDAYGRRLLGTQPVTVRIGYVYKGDYQRNSRFGYNGNGVLITGSKTRQDLTIWQVHRTELRGVAPRAFGPAGWSLDVQHAYDPVGRVLLPGDGPRRPSDVMDQVASTVVSRSRALCADGTAACGDGGPATSAILGYPRDVVVAADGSYYVADLSANRVRHVGTDGIIRNVAGNGLSTCFGSDPCGDGGSATQAKIPVPVGLALGADGSLYIALRDSFRVRRVDPSGVISSVAGTGALCLTDTDPCGDGGPATDALLGYLSGIAVAPDGSVIIAAGNNRVRRVGTDGTISTMAGTGAECGPIAGCGDGGPATQAQLRGVLDVAASADGSIYVAELLRVRRITPDGIIRTVAGNNLAETGGDGGPATSAGVRPVAIALEADGSLLISTYHGTIRLVTTDGIIRTIAGSGSGCGAGDTIFTCGEGGPAKALRFAANGIGVAPDGSIYTGDPGTGSTGRVVRIASGLPGLGRDESLIPSPDGSEVFVFAADGRHLRTVDSITAVTLAEFAYTPAGLLSSVRDRSGNVTVIERNGAGAPTAIVGPYGQRTVLVPNPEGGLATVRNPAGEETRFTYFAGDLLETMTTPRAHVYTMSYDAFGRLASDADPAGGEKTLVRTRTANGFVVDVTAAISPTDSKTTTYGSETLASGDESRTFTDTAGHTTVSELSAAGTRTIDAPDDSLQTVEYAPDPRFAMLAPVARNNVLTMDGGSSLAVFTARSVTLSEPGNLLSLATLTDTVNRNGLIFTRSITTSGGVKSLTERSQLGRRIRTTLDEIGRPVRQELIGLAPLLIGYDVRGRVSSITRGEDNERRSFSLSYDALGRLQRLTDPLGRGVTYEYDAADRVIRQTLHDGRVVELDYDESGNLISLTPPGRLAHGLDYTPVDLLESYEPPVVSGSGTTATTYEYNLDRRPTSINRPDGSSVALSYEPSTGRLSGVTLPSALGGQLGYAYDSQAGRLSSLTGPGDAKLEFGYDSFLQTLTRFTCASAPCAPDTVDGRVEHTFDDEFRIQTETVNGAASAQFSYDADGLLEDVGELHLTRHPFTGLIEQADIGVVSETWTHSEFGEPESHEVRIADVPVFRIDYTGRDRLGRITTRTETAGATPRNFAYTYDPAGRLVEVDRPDLTATYEYDANGNRTSAPNLVGTASYDGQDRLLAYGSTSYTYTANGELASKTTAAGVTAYASDALGNLRSVTPPSGSPIEYIVDGLGRRIGKKVGSTVTRRYLWSDQLRLVAEVDAAGTVLSRYVYGTRSNVPDFLVRAGITYRIVTDHLGSPRLVIQTDGSQAGTIVQRTEYDEFGGILSQQVDPSFEPIPFGFAGGLYDSATELVRLGARDYDPVIGRWTSKDPILFVAGDPNVFAYVQNDPVNSFDPRGLAKDSVTAALEQAVADGNLAEVQTILEAAGNGLKGSASNGQLQSAIGELFRAADQIPGGTAGAIREAVRKGLSDPGHIQKAFNRMNELQKLLNSGLCNSDTALARAIMADLAAAIESYFDAGLPLP